MRRFSNILSFLAVALFLLCAGSVTKADGTDPVVGLGGGGTCAGTTTFSENSLTQAFSGLQTGCINDFQNLTGVTLDTLVVNVTSSFTGQITCALLAGAPLSSTTPNGSSPTSCTFFDATLIGSITSGGPAYGLTFDTHFGPTVDIVLAQTVIPEPATLLLLGTGLAALAANRKRLKAATHLV